MKRILFLGSKEIGLFCLKHLFNNRKLYEIEIIGVIPSDNKSSDFIKAFSNKNNLKISTLSNFNKLDNVDLIISVQYDKILKSEHINKVSQYAVNLHMAPLPEYRGCNQFSFAIINEETEFGTTLHLMNEGIDSGDILFERRFKIDKNINVFELLNITIKESKKLFKDNIKKIIHNEIDPISQDSLNKKSYFYSRKDIKKIKEINLDWDSKKIQKYLRATMMPGFSQPFFYMEGKKIFFQNNNCND